MSRTNPLVLEALRGLSETGKVHRAHLGYLALQGLVLFLWWPPANDLYHVLATGNPPDTLPAVVMALGATLAYYSLRAGAEEVLLPGQHPLGEWALASPLPLGRIMRGYLGGHLLQALHAIALSSPLLLTAFSVGGGTWTALSWGLATALVQATFYRLAGALIYLEMGHRRALTLLSLRAVLLLGYALPPFAAPAASHLMVSYRLFQLPSPAPRAAALPEPLLFMLVYAGLCAALTCVLCLVLSRHRRDAASARRIAAGAARG